MKAFHGDPEVKAKYVARLAAHHAADEIIQGEGWNGSHGCAVGCTLNKYDHQAYENELGLLQWLARLEDRIFEGLPPVKAQQFAVDFLNAIPVGADVAEVRFKLAAQRLYRDRDRQATNPATYAKQCVAALEQVIAYCANPQRTDEQRSAAWSASAAESESDHFQWEAATLIELLRAAPQAA